MENFKYTSKFQIQANLKAGDFQEEFISKANLGLDDLKTLLPDGQVIANNPDLLYTVFNAAVVNLINLNGDGMTTKGALKLVETCMLKPMNIEHYRGDIVGVIVNHSFSSFGENKILTPDDLKDDPFNISLAAIVWKLANRGFAEYIQAAQDEDSYFYGKMSASWEIGFNSYKLALGSKDLRKAKIVEDPEEIKALSKHLLCEGGNGFTADGTEVYRIIDDEGVRFLGCAFTSNPAAPVKGVVAVDYRDYEESSGAIVTTVEKTNDLEQKVEEIAEKIEKLEKNEPKISEASKKRVKKYMKYKNVDELVDNLQTAEASAVREFIVAQVDAANEKFLQTQKEKEEQKAELETALADAKSLKSDSEKLAKELDEVKATLKAQEDQSKFNDRISSLKEQYDIDQVAAKSISKSIFGLSDEAFAGWLEDMKPFLRAKTEEQEDTNVSTASNQAPPNAQSADNDKLSKYREAFSKVKVTVTK